MRDQVKSSRPAKNSSGATSVPYPYSHLTKSEIVRLFHLANSRAARLLLSPVGATMYSLAATRPSKVWAASSTVWNASTRTDKINDHGFIRIEARASLEEGGRLFLVHVV